MNLDVDDNFWILVSDTTVQKLVDVGDQNGQNRHQHVIVVTNLSRLQHRCYRLLLQVIIQILNLANKMSFIHVFPNSFFPKSFYKKSSFSNHLDIP